MIDETWMLIGLLALVFGALVAIAALSNRGSLNSIKNKTVGDGQYGTARWATEKEIRKSYRRVPFRPALWRKGEQLPEAQGLVLGCVGKKDRLAALVDCDDIHCLMIGASGVGKTAYFLYPNMEYACASGMSFLALDTKGDLARNYGAIATKYYGYQVAVVDLRNPTRSDGYNLLTLINHYMDVCRQKPDNLAARARSEKYAKILSKTIINPEGESFAQNQYFYDAAEGVLTAVILLLAEYLPPKEIDGELRERRHIVSVFKLVQELLAPSMVPGRNEFQFLMDHLPEEHKAKWFSGSALNAAEQSMASVMSTVLARLNTFLDSELEQVLCFDSAMDAESFASRKSAIFLILPEEDTTKNFMAGLMIQTLSRELFSVADEHDGKLQNRVVFFCDELGTMRAFDILPPLLRRPLPPAHPGAHHSVLGTAGEELRERGSGDHPGQCAGHHLRRLCPQQQNRRGSFQSPGQPHGYERNHLQRQERVRPITADDPTPSHDAGRTQITSQGSLHCHENRYSPHAYPAAVVPGVGYHLWKTVPCAGKGCPEGVLCRQKGVPTHGLTGIPSYRRKLAAERLSYPKKGQMTL